MDSSLDWKTNITPGGLWIRSAVGISHWDREMESEWVNEEDGGKEKERMEKGVKEEQRCALEGNNSLKKHQSI